MLSATDSFLQYLSENLAADSVTVHWRRITADDENSDALKMDCLNVQFLGFWEDGNLEDCLVSLDLLGRDERQTLTKLAVVRDLLIAEQFTSEIDYATVGEPATGSAISWDDRDIKFLNVRIPKGQRYVHYNCTFPLRHVR